ncbi:MAG: DUF6516 family protein [Nitrospirota bacterium]
MIGKYFDGLFQELFISRAVSSFNILRCEKGDDDGYIRLKCILLNGDILEFAEYVQVRRNKINIETYNFHWQTAKGKLIKRWDNVGHHKEIDTCPDHLHITEGQVISSSPMNLKKVITEIEKTLTIKDEM